MIDPTNSVPPYLNNLSSLNHAPRSHTMVTTAEHLESPMRLKLAVVGFEERNIRTAPLNDASWDVAGFNMGNRLGIHADAEGRFRADLWFDLHPLGPQSVLDLAWIEACPVPIYTPTVFSSNPCNEAFPLDHVQAFFLETCGVRPGYFASSAAMILAWAIWRGYQTIGLFGMSMNFGRERIVERANLEFWIGLAMGLGIDVVLSTESKLLTHPGIYGFDYDTEKQGVIEECANTVRQLLTQEEYKAGIDKDLQDRMDALLAVRQGLFNAVDNMLFADRAQLVAAQPVLIDTEEETRI